MTLWIPSKSCDDVTMYWSCVIPSFCLCLCISTQNTEIRHCFTNIVVPFQCRPEYKVPGLYVIDSVVRQSRHQFGQEKDVFMPRLCKNIINTFKHLYKCPAEEKVCNSVKIISGRLIIFLWAYEGNNSQVISNSENIAGIEFEISLIWNSNLPIPSPTNTE